MTATIKAAQILADPTASYWLKDALRSAMARDPVDAANDAEFLSAVLAEIADERIAAATRNPPMRQA